MEAKINVLQPQEVDRYLEIQLLAFEAEEADTITRLRYSQGISRERLRAKLIRQLLDANVPGDEYFTAKDGQTEEILGVAWWKQVPNLFRNRDEVGAAFERKLESLEAFGLVGGVSVEQRNALLSDVFHEGFHVFPGQAYLDLRLLVVHPHYHAKDIDTKLLKHGLEKAGELGLPCLTIATSSARTFYERHGFVVHREFPFIGYGELFSLHHWTMVRYPDPKPSTEEEH